MNRFDTQLAEFCDRYPLTEKILVNPSLIGHQIAEGLVRGGHPWVNLRVETVYTLARAIVAEDLSREGLKVLSRAQAQAMVEHVCSDVLTENSYFGSLRDRPGFHRAMMGTLEDLRTALVTSEELLAEPVEIRPKIQELQAIARAYDGILAQNRFADQVEVVRLAMRKLTQIRDRKSGTSVCVLPESLDLSTHERTFLNRLGAGRIHILPVDQPAQWQTNLLSMQMFRALGEENEIREVFRRLLQNGIELDRAEILYAEGSTYLPLIYELAAQYGFPCTYGEGIPVLFSRPGQAVLAYLDWLEQDYDAACFGRMVGTGLLDLRGMLLDSKPPRALDAMRILRDARIRWGRDRYLSCLAALAHSYEVRLNGQKDDPAEKEDQDVHVRRLNDVKSLHSVVERVLSMTPGSEDGTITLGALAHGAARFVEGCVRISGELDGIASEGLRQLCDELASLPERRLRVQEAIQRLREAVRNLHVGVSTPKPGHLHVSDCVLGGYSTREHIFIVGMDESRYPGSGLQDPVLLDRERIIVNRVIHPRRLRILGEGPGERRQALRSCLARLRGRVVMSYSCRDLLEDRERFPATVMLEIYRVVSKRPESDYSSFREALGPASGFIPQNNTILDETEWWLDRIKQPGLRGEPMLSHVESTYPWLGRGRQAEEARARDRFTVFDGWVKDARGALDPRRNRQPLSCTQIETLARCPFVYFLRHVLKITPPQDRRRDATVWLDPAEFGRLLHEVFRIFMTQITARGEKPGFARHWGSLKKVADGSIERWRDRIPPPKEVVFAAQRDRILLACETFLKEEEIHCHKVKPCHFEVPFGLPRMDAAPSLGSEDPVSIDLGGGCDFLLRGRVDRVDQRRADEYEVWDYKTGSPHKLREEKLFDRGRQIQHALYARAVEILLARAGRPGRVVCSGYFFPGPKGEGVRIAGRDDRKMLRRVLCSLCDLLREGVFPSLPDSDFCPYCDYLSVCGGLEQGTRKIIDKLKNQRAGGSVLEPFHRLMDGED